MIPLALKRRPWLLKRQLPHEVYVGPSQVTGKEESRRFRQIDKDKIVIEKTGFDSSRCFMCVMSIIPTVELAPCGKVGSRSAW